jgi:hypothetical protein
VKLPTVPECSSIRQLAHDGDALGSGFSLIHLGEKPGVKRIWIAIAKRKLIVLAMTRGFSMTWHCQVRQAGAGCEGGPRK